MDKSTHQIRCEQWRIIINNCLASGMTRKVWCKENNISEKSFYYWQRILRNEAYIEQKQMKPAVQTSEVSVAFVELGPIASSGIRGRSRSDVIIRKQDISLEIANSVFPELLKRLGGLFHAKMNRIAVKKRSKESYYSCDADKSEGKRLTISGVFRKNCKRHM